MGKSKLVEAIVEKQVYLDLNKLTPIQRRRYYAAVVDGMTRREIAQMEDSSPWSISNSLKEIGRKIDRVTE